MMGSCADPLVEQEIMATTGSAPVYILNRFAVVTRDFGKLIGIRIDIQSAVGVEEHSVVSPFRIGHLHDKEAGGDPVALCGFKQLKRRFGLLRGVVGIAVRLPPQEAYPWASPAQTMTAENTQVSLEPFPGLFRGQPLVLADFNGGGNVASRFGDLSTSTISTPSRRTPFSAASFRMDSSQPTSTGAHSPVAPVFPPL